MWKGFEKLKIMLDNIVSSLSLLSVGGFDWDCSEIGECNFE